MKFREFRTVFALPTVIVFAFFALPIFAQAGDQTGKLKIHVHPRQAYVFVDGTAIRDGSQTLSLKPGSHDVSVRNYGYIPETRSVEINSGETTGMTMDLQKSGDKVAGPFGDIEFKGHPRAAVGFKHSFLEKRAGLQGIADDLIFAAASTMLGDVVGCT